MVDVINSTTEPKSTLIDGFPSKMCLHWNHFVLKQPAIILRNQESGLHFSSIVFMKELSSVDLNNFQVYSKLWNKTKQNRALRKG